MRSAVYPRSGCRSPQVERQRIRSAVRRVRSAHVSARHPELARPATGPALPPMTRPGQWVSSVTQPAASLSPEVSSAEKFESGDLAEGRRGWRWRSEGSRHRCVPASPCISERSFPGSSCLVGGTRRRDRSPGCGYQYGYGDTRGWRAEAGEEGFEPSNGGSKVRCLTTWRLPRGTTDRSRVEPSAPGPSDLEVDPGMCSRMQRGRPPAVRRQPQPRRPAVSRPTRTGRPPSEWRSGRRSGAL